jgi:hypothetical protein
VTLQRFIEVSDKPTPFSPEDGSSKFLRGVANYLLLYGAITEGGNLADSRESMKCDTHVLQISVTAFLPTVYN